MLYWFQVVMSINQNINIPRQHKDIALRSMSAMFKDEVLPFLGLNLPKVIEVIQTIITKMRK
ncbi:hypothetical protein M1N64_02730 [Peptococcaceae bacterium]|nr:hypothetical protein [Peptococcaceae bacterium]